VLLRPVELIRGRGDVDFGRVEFAASRRRGASVLAPPRSDAAAGARPEDRPLELRLSTTPRVIANAVSNEPRFRRSTPSRRFARASLARASRALG